MNNLPPLVSIIIPVYNGENYVCDAIDSCLLQKYKNIEIIVVNDGSVDSTEKICKSYKDKIKYFFKKNGGVASALNLGIEKSSGDYISWLSHDDYYLPNKISDEIKVLSEAKKNSIVFSNYQVVNKRKKKILEVNFEEKFSSLNDYPQYFLIYTCLLNGCAMLFPKIVFMKYGKFDEKLKYTQDYKKWGEIIDSDFVYNETYVLCSRRHDKQDTEMYAINNYESDDLWYYLLTLLYKNKNYNKFLGYQESLYFFKCAFSRNNNMIKTNNFIKENADFSNLGRLRKNIRKKIPDFESKTEVLKKTWNFYKIFGLKKLIIKLINYWN